MVTALEAVVAAAPGRAGRGRVARRSDQGRDRALHRRAPRPVPAHRRVARVGHRVRAVGARRGDGEVQRHRQRSTSCCRARAGRRPMPANATTRGRERIGMSAEIIELDDVDGLGTGAVGEPGQRAFYIQARTEATQLTVLVEKEQVALLAAEAVAFLDQIADDYPELPFDIPSTQSVLREPTVPLFRARLIGLGFDPERELVLIELRERADDEAEEPADDDDATTRATSPASTPPGRRCGRWPPGASRPSPAAARRARCASSRWTRPGTRVLAGTDARRAPGRTGVGRARGRRPDALLVERDLPRRGEGRRRGARRDLQAPARRAAAVGLPPGHALPARGGGVRAVRRCSAGTSCRSRSCATVRSASARCSASSTTIPTSTSSPCATSTRTASASSPGSTCSSTTPTARVGTACSTRPTT